MVCILSKQKEGRVRLTSSCTPQSAGSSPLSGRALQAGRLWTNLRICGASSDLDSCHLVGRRQTCVGLHLLLSSLQQPSPRVALKMSRNNAAGTANKGRLPPALLDLCALGFLQRHADFMQSMMTLVSGTASSRSVKWKAASPVNS